MEGRKGKMPVLECKVMEFAGQKVYLLLDPLPLSCLTSLLSGRSQGRQRHEAEGRRQRQEVKLGGEGKVQKVKGRGGS